MEARMLKRLLGLNGAKPATDFFLHFIKFPTGYPMGMFSNIFPRPF